MLAGGEADNVAPSGDASPSATGGAPAAQGRSDSIEAILAEADDMLSEMIRVRALIREPDLGDPLELLRRLQHEADLRAFSRGRGDPHFLEEEGDEVCGEGGSGAAGEAAKEAEAMEKAGDSADLGGALSNPHQDGIAGGGGGETGVPAPKSDGEHGIAEMAGAAKAVGTAGAVEAPGRSAPLEQQAPDSEVHRSARRIVPPARGLPGRPPPLSVPSSSCKQQSRPIPRPGAASLPKMDAPAKESVSRESMRDEAEAVQLLLDQPTPEERRAESVLAHYLPGVVQEQDAAFKTAIPDSAYPVSEPPGKGAPGSRGGTDASDTASSNQQAGRRSGDAPSGSRGSFPPFPGGSLSPEEEERVEEILGMEIPSRTDEPLRTKLGTGFYPSIAQMARDAQICAQLAELVPVDRVGDIIDLVPVQLVGGEDGEAESAAPGPVGGRRVAKAAARGAARGAAAEAASGSRPGSKPAAKSGQMPGSKPGSAQGAKPGGSTPRSTQGGAARSEGPSAQNGTLAPGGTSSGTPPSRGAPSHRASQRPTLSMANSQTTVRLGPPPLSEAGMAHWIRRSKDLVTSTGGTEVNLDIPKINGMPDWIREERASQIVAAHLRALESCLQDLQRDEIAEYIARRGKGENGAPLPAPLRRLSAEDLRPLILDFYMTPANMGASPPDPASGARLADGLGEEDRTRLEELLRRTREQATQLLDVAGGEGGEGGAAALWEPLPREPAVAGTPPHPETVLESMLLQSGDSGAAELRDFEDRIQEERKAIEKHCTALDGSFLRREKTILDEADRRLARAAEGPPPLPESQAQQKPAPPRSVLPQALASPTASPGLSERRARPQTPQRLPPISE